MSEQEKFIEKIGPLASQDMKKSSILASVTAAQAILESGYGSTDLALAAKNFFGMKCTLSGNSWGGSTWDGVSKYTKKTQEQDKHGNPRYIDADFRKYKTMADSISDHSAYLLGAMNGTKKRYAGLAGCTNYRDAITIIKNGGYATDMDYIEKICSVIEKWNLTRFDNGAGGKKGMKIYISPSDQTGNKYAYGGTNEHAQCQKIAEAAAKALKRNGYTVKVGSEGSTYQERTAESNTWGADVHMPIHTNAGGGDGTTMFAYPGSVNNKYVQAVYKSVAAITPGTDDGIRAMSSLYEINNSKCVCVYLECEFHDRADLAKWIIEHTAEIGEAIAKGYCNADGKKYKAAGSGSTEGGKMYRVQIGAFSKQANAEALVKKAKAAGFDACIKQE